MRLGALVVLLLGAPALAEVTYKAYYEGLPKLDELRPFAAPTGAQVATLRRLLSGPPPASCEGAGDAVVGAQPVCGPAATEIRDLLGEMARGLVGGQFSRLWLTAPGTGEEPVLLAQYDRREAESGDRYAALFAFRWRGDWYGVTAASWFLEGSLHALRPFAPGNGRAAFIRFVSCTECHAWVYLLAWDFVRDAAYEFSYELHDEAWTPVIEYALPGMGHSIDARVETRIPEQSPSGPHLLQHFDVEDAEDEWWSFRCQGLRCRPQVSKGHAPAWFAEAWEKADRL